MTVARSVLMLDGTSLTCSQTSLPADTAGRPPGGDLPQAERLLAPLAALVRG